MEIFLRERENSNFKVLGRAAFGQPFNTNKNVCNCTLYQTLFSVLLGTKVICARSWEQENWPFICHFPGGKARFLTVKFRHQMQRNICFIPKLQEMLIQLTES